MNLIVDSAIAVERRNGQKKSYLCGMKEEMRHRKRMRSKGERLKWLPLKEARNEKLRLFACVGVEVTREELERRNHDKRSILVP